MSQTTYAGFKSLRATDNSAFVASEDENAVVLRTFAANMSIWTRIDKHASADTANLADYRASLEPFANAPVEIEEVRFQTHDFSDNRDWDGRTHGDQTAWFVGGVVKHPIDGSWLDSTGAAMLAAYADPEDEHFQDPTYLFGALNYRITAWYDDVNYKWFNASDVEQCYLDTSAWPSVWRRTDTDAIIVEYRSTPDRWERTDTNANVTSSLWRILPYNGYKIQINEAWLRADESVTFNGVLHYKVYMDLAAGVAGVGYPAGNYKVKDWNYESLEHVFAGANRPPLYGPTVLAGHSARVVTIGYDYFKTKPQVIDSRANMHLDINIDGDVEMSNTLGARATFICLKIRSF